MDKLPVKVMRCLRFQGNFVAVEGYLQRLRLKLRLAEFHTPPNTPGICRPSLVVSEFYRSTTDRHTSVRKQSKVRIQRDAFGVGNPSP